MSEIHSTLQAGDRAALELSKVIQLATYKRYAMLGKRHCIWRITSSLAPPFRPESSLSRVSQIADSPESFLALKTNAVVLPPDLVLIDSFLTWTDPLGLIHFIHAHWGVPIVMLCRPSDTVSSASLVKQAYIAGISDALYAPFQEEEILETLEVLLKLTNSPKN